MKIFFRRIHLYLSLAAGLVILVACLTGAILVFEKDLQMALNKKRYYVEVSGEKMLPGQLISAVKEKYPEAKINGIKFYSDRNRSAEVAASFSQEQPAKEPAGKDTKPQRNPGFTIFINPYTGVILQKYSYRETFFYQVFALHRWLLGGEGSVGKYIVGVATFIFLFILITGIILWWPRTRKVLEQRIKIKWTAGWKRLNHDLHIVLGFYSAIFLFIFAFTGLAWSFEWFNKGIYTVTNSPMKNPSPPKSQYMAGKQAVSLDEVLSAAKSMNNAGVYYNLTKPKDSIDIFQVNVLPQNAVHESATDTYYFDQYTGKNIGKLEFRERSLGARVRSTFKPVHTGSIWGTPSKIIAFITCLFGISFPVTGTIMWFNRTRKKKKINASAEKSKEQPIVS